MAKYNIVEKVEMCSDDCCGKPITECVCGPDCEHCDCHAKNNINESYSDDDDNRTVSNCCGADAYIRHNEISVGDTSRCSDCREMAEFIPEKDFFESINEEPILEEGMVSSCCGAPLMSYNNGHGRCSDCKEMASGEEVYESTITEIDHAREYVRVHAPERMLGMHPVAKNAFLADLEKTYPGMRKDLGEGTWAVPENEDDVKVLTDLMQNPIPVGEEGDNAAEVMYGVLGDDELFDEFVEMAATLGPEADARPAIENRLKELGIMESMNFDEKRTDDLQVIAKDLFKHALANAKKKSKTATVKEDKLNEFGMLAPIAANLAVKGAEKLYKKYTDNKSSKGEAPSSPSPAAEPSKQHKQQPKIAQPKVQGLPNVKKAPPVRPDAARSKSTPKKPLAKEHIAPAVATPTAKPAVAKPAAKKAIRKPAGRTAAKPAMAAARKGVTQEGNAPEPRKMQVTTADRDNKTEAWKRFKAGDPAYEYKKLTPKTISGDN